MTLITAALLITMAGAASFPIGLTVLVTIASRREDAEWTLGGPPQRQIQSTARRILSFYSEGELPAPKGRTGGLQATYVGPRDTPVVRS